MIEADLCNKANCKLSEAGDPRRTANGQGADFLVQYEQSEVDYQAIDLTIGVNDPARSDQDTNLQFNSELGSPDGKKFSKSVRSGEFTSELDAIIIGQKSANPGSILSEVTPVKAPISPEIAADGLLASTAKPTETATHKSQTAVITAPAPVASSAASLQVLREGHALSDTQLPQADTLPTDPIQLGADLNIPDIEGLSSVASERTGGLVSEAPNPALQLAPVPGQSAITTPITSQITAPQAIITAAPAEIVDIIAQSLSATDERKDRIIVQLDPPELGRVSIDFKFDAQGLQHITITGETPEALRRLRMMHFDLIQTLERDGLTGHGMTFRQQDTSQNSRSDGSPQRAMPESIAAERTTISPITPPLKTAPLSLNGGGLNIKL